MLNPWKWRKRLKKKADQVKWMELKVCFCKLLKSVACLFCIMKYLIPLTEPDKTNPPDDQMVSNYNPGAGDLNTSNVSLDILFFLVFYLI